ncbi:MAG: family 10 glycosylhydrolase [Spirulinaceae cyanobacterium RM2_2_10]|nr:family 10 glycosylhydrolase [Spirulinaceae cyanobacterium SM2_1_0]NJO18817.1 family 10 glycosylhydrolase [Spirulinaceae cyanobacterium RM2_2_10]
MLSGFRRFWRPRWRRWLASLLLGVLLVVSFGWQQPVRSQSVGAYCRFLPNEIARKEALRQAAIGEDANARNAYQTVLREHSALLQRCRQQVWPRTQAIWLRLYPCDAQPGGIESIFDRIVNKGYNEVYLEVFYNSQVLLPAADNPTPWLSVLRSPGSENVDLLAEAIRAGRERGVKVYAWLFSMNYGYAYGVRRDRQNVLARNGRGQNSLAVVHDGSQAFVDPYNRQAQAEYLSLVQSVVRRRPDGILFDYIRYPRSSGADSVADQVQDLWIYGEASRQALLNRATNPAGRALINLYLQKGTVSAGDISAVQQQYGSSPSWQGLQTSSLTAGLWQLVLAHATQGVVDFLNMAARPVQQAGIPAGAVFFPGGNQSVGRGFDSRLQPWDRFSPSLQWHPMSYAVCNRADCIVDEVKRVVNQAASQTEIVPALAGYWGRGDGQRPSLEAQMQALQQQVPQLNAVSHFAYSWQEPQSDRQRQFCQLR